MRDHIICELDFGIHEDAKFAQLILDVFNELLLALIGLAGNNEKVHALVRAQPHLGGVVSLQLVKVLWLLVEGMVLVVMLLALIFKGNVGFLAIAVEFKTFSFLATIGRLSSQPLRTLLRKGHVRQAEKSLENVRDIPFALVLLDDLGVADIKNFGGKSIKKFKETEAVVCEVQRNLVKGVPVLQRNFIVVDRLDKLLVRNVVLLGQLVQRTGDQSHGIAKVDARFVLKKEHLKPDPPAV